MTPEQVEEALTTLAVSLVELRRDVDRVPGTLREIVEALTAADEAISERIDSHYASFLGVPNTPEDVAFEDVLTSPPKLSRWGRAKNWLASH